MRIGVETRCRITHEGRDEDPEDIEPTIDGRISPADGREERPAQIEDWHQGFNRRHFVSRGDSFTILTASQAKPT